VTALVPSLLLLATLAGYGVSKKIYARRRRIWFSPMLLTPAVLLVLLWLCGVSCATYGSDTRLLVWMLGPATIAYAWPIHQRREILRRYPLTLAAGVTAAVSIGLGTAWAFGRLFALPPRLAESLLPRTVSTPFAIVASRDLGGSTGVTVACVILTGLFGMAIGEIVLDRFNMRSHVVRGASLGASASALGTAKAYESSEVMGAVASLTMVFSGVVMVLAAPWLGLLLEHGTASPRIAVVGVRRVHDPSVGNARAHGLVHVGSGERPGRVAGRVPCRPKRPSSGNLRRWRSGGRADASRTRPERG
jgi:putative effector of murein hydrolase